MKKIKKGLWGKLIFLGFLAMFLSRSIFGAETESLIRGAMPNVDANSRFIVYYGDDYYQKDAHGNTLRDANNRWQLNLETLNKLIQFDVVVLQPNQAHCTPEVIEFLKASGVDYVLGYISIGEQSATQPEIGDGSGPLRYDEASNSLLPTHQGIASFYVDVDTQWISYNYTGKVDAVETIRRLYPDGNPDINPHFAGYMIHPDSAWRDYIKNMRIDLSNNVSNSQAGLDQLAGVRSDNPWLHQERDENFGFDGFFLDTIDTAGPYNASGWYPWVLEAMRDTVQFISDTYPEKIVFANRGGFYFQAGLQSPVTGQYPIDYSIRPYVNAFLFESYMYDSDPSVDGDEYQTSEFYYDNRYNQMPKIVAEAQREDGFSLFILEYDAGRSQYVPDFIQRVLNEDMGTWGASTYISNDGSLSTINTGLLDVLPFAQNSPPRWHSTAYGYMGQEASKLERSRQGIVEAFVSHTAGELQEDIRDDIIVRWDVAHAQSHPVQYTVYWSQVADILTANAVPVSVQHIEMTAGYAHNPSALPAYQTVLKDFAPGTYYFWVRAKDAQGREEHNEVMRAVTIAKPISNIVSDLILDGDLRDWGNYNRFADDPADIPGVFTPQIDLLGLQLAHNDQQLYIAYEFERVFDFVNTWGYHLYLDTDFDATTGFSYDGHIAIGADYLLQNQLLFRWDEGNKTWINTNYRVPFGGGNTLELAIDRAQIGYPEKIKLLFAGFSSALDNGVDAVDVYPDGVLDPALGLRFVSYHLK